MVAAKSGKRDFAIEMSKPEVWLRGPIDGVPSHLQPVAHSLLQCREEISEVLADITPERIWAAPPNAASIGFHVLLLPTFALEFLPITDMPATSS